MFDVCNYEKLKGKTVGVQDFTQLMLKVLFYRTLFFPGENFRELNFAYF